VMEAVKEHGIETILDGQGGDELFGGYASYFLPFWKSLLSQWMVKDFVTELFYVKNTNISYRNVLRASAKNFAERNFNKESLAKWTKKQELNFLNSELKRDYFALPDIKTPSKDVLNDYLFESYEMFLPNISRWVESAAESFGINSIMPFANYKKLTEYVFSIPSTFKIHKGWSKYLLRSAMVGIVPDEIRWRKQKIGFQTPDYYWLQEIGEEIKKQIQELNDPIGFVDKKQLLQKWTELYTAKNFHFQQFVFRYYSYLTWINNL